MHNWIFKLLLSSTGFNSLRTNTIILCHSLLNPLKYVASYYTTKQTQNIYHAFRILFLLSHLSTDWRKDFKLNNVNSWQALQVCLHSAFSTCKLLSLVRSILKLFHESIKCYCIFVNILFSILACYLLQNWYIIHCYSTQW